MDCRQKKGKKTGVKCERKRKLSPTFFAREEKKGEAL